MQAPILNYNTSTITVDPLPGSDCTDTLPPINRTRSCIPDRPSLPLLSKSHYPLGNTEPPPIIADGYPNLTLFKLNGNLGFSGFGVTAYVSQCFLGNAEKHQLCIIRHTPLIADNINAGFDTRIFGNVDGEPLQCQQKATAGLPPFCW